MELLALILAGLIAAGLFAFFLVGFTLIDAIVLSVLWGWFMVPTFGLPALGLVAAIGVSLVWNWFNRAVAKETDQAKTIGEAANLLFMPLFRAGFVLAFGYVVHLFMA